MLDRFRSLALSVIRRRSAIKALSPPSPTDAESSHVPVSMEYLSKLQDDYTTLLTKIDAVTDKLSPHSRRQNSLWSSLAVEGYFDLIFRAYATYTKLVPYWDPTKLPNFGWHWTHRVVRSKALNRIVEFSSLLGFAKSLRGQKAAVFLSLLQEELDDYSESSDRSAILDLLRDLSDASGELPSTFWLANVKCSTRRAYGGDAEVWVGSYAGQEVAVRDFWFPSEMSPQRLQKVIRKEILANRQLNHPNVLRLIGVFNEESRPMSVVTPWMANGVALTYLESHPVELRHILQGAIDGMQYLHSLDPPIIHGAIQPRNILVNAEGDAVIRDLGITRVRMEAAGSIDERIAGFSPRYQAPELMINPSSGSNASTHSHSSVTAPAPSFATDVYSLAMSFYHITTRLQPFHNTSHPTLNSPTSILRAVLAGERPPTPPLPQHRVAGAGGNLCDEDLVALWAILTEMWDKDPQKRPNMSTAAARIMRLENRPPCEVCIDQHRGRECIRLTDNGPCTDCSTGGVECVEVIEASAGRGYGTNIMGRESTVDGYYITTLELPPSPEGALVPGPTLETRRIRLVPFQWQRRRRASGAHASRK